VVPIIAGIFLILHGIVHLLYAAQSWRVFQLQPGMLWPDGSWLFARLIGNSATHYLASIALVLIALGFAAGGLGLFFQQDWWRPAAVGAAAFSSALYLLMWDGSFQAWDAKGGIGLLINALVLLIVLVFKWVP
jgi:hypothetical protein